ncbi:Ankyrin repeat-containing protein [Glarea lozoyensis ATCC 20868]|uniref:Ankyrin repeat-containing protein n=1 Tax=Glarea lozoyensis (strain ATCC 20868 / MF5171) TaxID=1116229 RepID=S3D072_GLAL2|nr:Ankyrin repeat-containing protein [Glarea lozoyensis ATCC 20868]EPE30559.1 Ankyrin repeat-containing protein [Glarea lozoyensis ATCC 20868]
MEVLSGVSSVIAIVSLTVQTANGVKKLSDFWSSIQNAPQSVSDIIEDLAIVSNALEDIGHEADSARPHSRSLDMSLSCLRSCSEKVQRLQKLLEELQSGLSATKRRKRAWSSFKVVWSENKIANFQNAVRELKTTLLITRQTATSKTITANQESQQRELSSIRDAIDSLLQRELRCAISPSSEKQLIANLKKEIDKTSSARAHPQSTSADQETMNSTRRINTSLYYHCADQRLNPEIKVSEAQRQENSGTTSSSLTFATKTLPYRHIINSIFGVVEGTLTTFSITPSACTNAAKHHCTRHLFILHPSRLLRIFGFESGLRMSFLNSGLFDFQLNSYQAVPDNSAIFHFTKNGDITSIQGLFKDRLASPFDTNSKGLTPLFFAAQFGHVEICKLLIDEGADAKAYSFMKEQVVST